MPIFDADFGAENALIVFSFGQLGICWRRDDQDEEVRSYTKKMRNDNEEFLMIICGWKNTNIFHSKFTKYVY